MTRGAESHKIQREGDTGTGLASDRKVVEAPVPEDSLLWDAPEADPLSDIKLTLERAFENEWPPQPTRYVVSPALAAWLEKRHG